MQEREKRSLAWEQGTHGPPISLPVFSGPLDLLLHLIKKDRLSIYDIPIARICTQYHDYLRAMQQLDLDVAAEFLWVASWLVLIKSRTLLPRGDQPDHDPREELVERLLEYRRVKAIADQFHAEDVVRRCLWRPAVAAPEKPDDDSVALSDVDVGELVRTYLTVLQRLDRNTPILFTVLPLRHNVHDKMRHLYRLVCSERLLRFMRYVRSLSETEDAVTSIVAVLELARLGGIRAEQRTPFAEIYLRPGPRTLAAEDLEPEDEP